MYCASSGLMHNFMFNLRVLSNQGTVCYFEHVMCCTFHLEIDGTIDIIIQLRSLSTAGKKTDQECTQLLNARIPNCSSRSHIYSVKLVHFCYYQFSKLGSYQANRSCTSLFTAPAVHSAEKITVHTIR